jgi:hypothetical protein
MRVETMGAAMMRCIVCSILLIRRVDSLPDRWRPARGLSISLVIRVCWSSMWGVAGVTASGRRVP